MKKISSLLLSLVVLITAFSSGVIQIFAEDDSEYKIFENYEYYTNQFVDKPYEEAIIVAYNGNEKNVVIPDEVDGYPVRCIGGKIHDDGYPHSAFENNTIIESVVIPNTVIEIGDDAFYGCISLKKVYIPNGVEYVHMGAFQNCPSLESITFPESVISAILPFDDRCVNLKEIVVLNKEMSVDLRDYSTIPSTLIIYGFRNSQAEIDAEYYGVNFVALDKPILQEGTNTQYVIGSNVGAKIHCAYPLNEFVSAEINGNIVDSKNYTLEKGSTILTFKTSYLDTLGVGNYTIKLNYNNATANASLVIKNSTVENESSESEQEKNINKNVENKKNDKKSPQTGVSNSSTCLSLVILGIALLILVFKKEKHKKSLN